MNVLYIDGVGPFGGASRSLYELVRTLSSREVKPYFVCVRGTALNFYSRVAVDFIASTGLTRFDNTLYGYYRGSRWLILLRELSYLPFTLISLFQARRRWKDIDLIHVNELTEIIPLLLARLLFRVPVVVHVRSLTWSDSKSLRCKWLFEKLRIRVDAIIAIDENVRATLPSDFGVTVVQNSFTPSSANVKDDAIIAKLECLCTDSLKIGFVGNLHHSKGLFDLLEAAKLVSERGEKVQFVIVGGSTRAETGLKSWLIRKAGFAQDVESELQALISRYSLQSIFHLLGPTIDIQSVYERIDVLCFPSHFDAPGRPVFEAAFSGVPCIAAVSKPRPDTLLDYETGIAVPPKNSERLADAICYFSRNRAEVTRMGINAKALAENNFNPEKNADRVLKVYSDILAAKRPR
ncbi:MULTISPECIES: glycosyltransferase family 4 protein [unclassified Pseudomonas]|uniref:glycosyltransferase family 4 protein n=1 Tax=unclassified Pseudomonas TaxID=196821 RepID=UPI001660E983|nr:MULTISPECIES: glycosyltransferase family 4 protein [unclassified Pseudomonas]MBD0702814.1 glycosyl transferase family 1 [Pseudomonas sp. PSB1]MDR8385178.1 glycosyltransferase family 4 protein [Pseudomonas sp. JL2]